jgi:hypothetical protein
MFCGDLASFGGKDIWLICAFMFHMSVGEWLFAFGVIAGLTRNLFLFFSD